MLFLFEFVNNSSIGCMKYEPTQLYSTLVSSQLQSVTHSALRKTYIFLKMCKIMNEGKHSTLVQNGKIER